MQTYIRSKRPLPKAMRQLSMSPNQGGPPTKRPLKVMHPNSSHEARNASTSRYRHSHVMREPAPTSNIIGVVFGTHTLLGPWGLVSFLTQTNLFAKFLSCILSQQNLARCPYVHNVYKCTHEHTCDGGDREKHVYAVKGVHAQMELVSFETKIPNVYSSQHLSLIHI